MQNQPNNEYILEYEPVVLPQDFPVSKIAFHRLAEEITGLHIHNCFEIGYCCEGSGIFIVDKKVLPFSKGDISIIFSNQFHKALCEKGKSSVWHFIHLDPEKLLSEISVKELSQISNILKGSSDFINILSPDNYPDLVNLVRMIISELLNCHTSYESVVKGLLWAFIRSCGRLIVCEGWPVGHAKHYNILKVVSAINYISKHYTDEIDIGYLASLCSMSLTSFRRYFNNALQVPPLEYIVNLRIQTACSLLTGTNYPVLDISSKVGYNSLSSFNRHFKRIKGMSPLEWRATRSQR
jgi:AraC-like DNA-binding protein/quercetin dioxygenase-like cupin family protein